MASLIAILDLKGKPLIQRSYRDDVPPAYIDRFLPIILDLEEEGQQVTPCFTREGVNYMHIRHSNLYRESCTVRYMQSARHVGDNLGCPTQSSPCRNETQTPPRSFSSSTASSRCS